MEQLTPLPSVLENLGGSPRPKKTPVYAPIRSVARGAQGHMLPSPFNPRRGSTGGANYQRKKEENEEEKKEGNKK